MSALFEKRFFMFDFARGRKLIKGEIELLFKTLKKAGYNGLGWHLEGFFETKKYPGIVREGYLTIDEAKWVSNLAKEYSLELMPIINLVGHSECFVYHQERFTNMRKPGTTTQFNLFDAGLEEFAHNMIDELIEIYSPKYLHIGGDETVLNEQEKAEYVKFLSGLCKYVRDKGIEPCIWGDMLFASDDIIENFTKDVTVFDWFYNGHRKNSLKKFKDLGFKDIFVCPCNQGWDGTIGSQHHAPWGEWPIDDVPIEFNEAEAFLADAAELGIKNAMFTDWENNNGHNFWSQMDSNIRVALYMNGKEITKENIEDCLFGRQTPHWEITYLLQNIQHELYLAVFENKTQPDARARIKCRMSDAFFSTPVYTAWLEISADIANTDRVKGLDEDVVKARKLLDSWDAQTELEKLCKLSLDATICYTEALFSLMNFCVYAHEKYHEAAVLQFKNPVKSAECLGETINSISKLIDDVNRFKTVQEEYLKYAGQTHRDTLRLGAFAKSMSGIKNMISYFAENTANNADDVTKINVLPSWLMYINNMERFDIGV